MEQLGFEVHNSAGPKIYQTVLKLVETYSEHDMKTFFSQAVEQTSTHSSHSKTELQINYENQWEVSFEES